MSTPTPGKPARPEAHVVFAGVHMAFGSRDVFRSLSCAFPKGKLSVILGGSGSGKSTMLRLIGGLVRPLGGTIEVDGTDVTGLPETRLYDVRRKLGMMFQHGALLDSLTVFENLALPLRERSSFGEREIAERVHQRLAAVGLADVDDLLPGQLSGGMVKRVAVARAIMMEPVILLCDEPFSGLDPISAKRIERLLVGINRDLGITVVLVSHSVASTLRIADHVLILLPEGAVEGTLADLQRHADPRVGAFLGEEVAETLIGDDAHAAGAGR
jgi:phospholipid/cholesterol/gamma-HCH transport system ATP-binding protein